MQKLAAYQGQAHNASVIATFIRVSDKTKPKLLYLLICKLSWVLKEALKTLDLCYFYMCL